MRANETKQQPFEILDHDGIKLVYGVLTRDEASQVLTFLQSIVSCDAIQDARIAAHLGAQYAVGEPQAMDAVRSTLNIAGATTAPAARGE